MKRFLKDKIEITDCQNSITVQAFRKGVFISFDLFSELTKIVPQTMQDAYNEGKKFINLDRELKPVKKETLITRMTL